MKTKSRNYDLRELSKKYPNKWVALTPDHKKIIDVGNELRDIALRIKGKDVVFLKILSSDSFYMPTSC